MNKPLAFWVLPTDRRLPLAFMNRTLYDLLNTSFEELCHTPSIGEKKIRSLLTILARVTQTREEELPTLFPEEEPLPFKPAETFDLTTLSELQWQNWQQTIIQHGFDREKLGRLCPNLLELPHAVWNRTLGSYCGKTLSEMWAMRTHGEKRVKAILRVFHNVCSVLTGVHDAKQWKIQLFPRIIYEVEQWTLNTVSSKSIPPGTEFQTHYTLPLLEQLKQDAAEQIVELAINRIGLHNEITNVRLAAQALGLARARVYQLLNEINDILMVRWPSGALLTSLLRNKCLNEAELQQVPEIQSFHAAAELFFPWGRRENTTEICFGMLRLSQTFEPHEPDFNDFDLPEEEPQDIAQVK
ncbi:MAG: hypothetical protein LBQ54_03370 [Planctomycetaceae bacterium]|nr:hypothetical protein [Planctomycetaceae bacterium]